MSWYSRFQDSFPTCTVKKRKYKDGPGDIFTFIEPRGKWECSILIGENELNDAYELYVANIREQFQKKGITV